jgi:hypothetical protein
MPRALHLNVGAAGPARSNRIVAWQSRNEKKTTIGSGFNRYGQTTPCIRNQAIRFTHPDSSLEGVRSGNLAAMYRSRMSFPTYT